MHNLSNELKICILKHLSFKDLNNFGSTSKENYLFLNDNIEYLINDYYEKNTITGTFYIISNPAELQGQISGNMKTFFKAIFLKDIIQPNSKFIYKYIGSYININDKIYPVNEFEFFYLDLSLESSIDIGYDVGIFIRQKKIYLSSSRL